MNLDVAVTTVAGMTARMKAQQIWGNPIDAAWADGYAKSMDLVRMNYDLVDNNKSSTVPCKQGTVQ